MFLGMGGLAILAWVVCVMSPLSALFERSPFRPGGWIFSWLTAIFWFPHIVASMWPLYKSRERILRFPITSIMVPAVIGLGAISAIHHPEGVLNAWAKLAMLWLGFHFSSQTLGLCLLFIRRSGSPAPDGTNILLGSFIFMSFIYPCLKAEAGPGSTGFIHPEVSLAPMGIPGWMEGLGLMGYVISMAGLLLFWVLFRARQGRFPPLLILAPMLAQALWLLPGAMDYGSRMMCFSIFHGIQYLLIGISVHLEERAKVAVDPHLPHFAWYEGFRFALLIIMIGLFLFQGLPYALQIFGLPLHMTRPGIWAGLIIFHAYVDGVLWKSRALDAAQAPFKEIQKGGRLPS